METDLRNKLLMFYDNFEDYGAYEINEYFNSEFGDDYDSFALDEKNLEALNYLNDEFIDIDIDYHNSIEFDIKVKKTLEKALKMLNNQIK